ncbi:MAG: hypothetical protein ACK418_12125, partial [Pseudomonas sp.]
MSKDQPGVISQAPIYLPQRNRHVSGFFVLALLVLFVVVVLAAVKIVPQGYNYTVERFGRYTRTLR